MAKRKQPDDQEIEGWGVCDNSRRVDKKCPHRNTRNQHLCTNNKIHVCPSEDNPVSKTLKKALKATGPYHDGHD